MPVNPAASTSGIHKLRWLVLDMVSSVRQRSLRYRGYFIHLLWENFKADETGQRIPAICSRFFSSRWRWVFQVPKIVPKTVPCLLSLSSAPNPFLWGANQPGPNFSGPNFFRFFWGGGQNGLTFLLFRPQTCRPQLKSTIKFKHKNRLD